MKLLRWLVSLFLFSALLAVSGCNGSSNSIDNATLNLYVADTPVDNATHVNIVFTGVEVQGGYGNSGSMMGSGSGSAGPIVFNFATPKNIDLMAQQGGNSAALLSGATLPAGNYQWIRLKIDPSQCTITLSDGSVHPLTIPSGSQTGLKLVSGFTMAAGQMANFTIEFNLRRSVTMANGGYMMSPAMRMMNNQQVGIISGSVSNTLSIGSVAISDPACSPAVYIYSGSGVTPVDINTTSSVQPVTTESLTLNTTTGNYDYDVSYLATGAYTLAVTCAAGDDPSQADTLAFSAAKNATVTAGQTTEVDFP
ncbi:MAG TPA: DUF4382 domain-containing protein [Gammaproteobacteria bacterium]